MQGESTVGGSVWCNNHKWGDYPLKDYLFSPPPPPLVGTVTLLMVKGDKRSKVFRDRILALNEFSRTNKLPEVSESKAELPREAWRSIPLCL